MAETDVPGAEANEGQPDAKRTPLPPLSRTVKLASALVLALTVVAIFLDRRQVPSGALLVQTNEPGLRVIICQGGRTIFPVSDRRSFSLRPGEYEVVAVEPARPFRVTPPLVRIRRGDHAIVRVESVIETVH